MLTKIPRLRANAELQSAFAEIATDRRAHRGRQSFVLLLGYRSCAGHAAKLVEHLDDPAVEDQVINTLYKMRAAGYSDAIRPLLSNPKTWIRNEAKRYIAWDAAS